MHHTLTIKPALNPKLRHRIEALLQEHGYDIAGGGTHADLSSCDITFDGNHPLDLNKPGAMLDKWWEDNSGDAKPATGAKDCYCPDCPEDCYRSGLADDSPPDDETVVARPSHKGIGNPVDHGTGGR